MYHEEIGRRIQVKKPPLGLTPKKEWDRRRCLEITLAIQRYSEAGKKIPNEWVL